MTNTKSKLGKFCVIFTFVLACLVASGLVVPVLADTTLFDDQGTSFWSNYNGGSGSIMATISADTSTVHSGTSSLKQVISAGNYSIVGFYHVFSPKVDWSTYSGVSFWLYGSNSSGYIYFAVLDNNSQYYLKMIVDNFNGWKQFTLDFSTAVYSGTVDLTNIYAVEFAFSNPAPSVLYVDQLVLIGGSSSPTPTPTLTPTTSPTSTPTSTPIFTPSPSPSASGQLTVYVVNGTVPVTQGVVTIGTSSVSLNSTGYAVFTGLDFSKVYHLYIVVNGEKVYDNEVFTIPSNGQFTVNLATEPSTSFFSLAIWLTIVALAIIVVVIIAWTVANRRVSRKTTQKITP